MIVPVPLGVIKATLTIVELDTVRALIVGAFGFVVIGVVSLDEIDDPDKFVEVIVKV